MFIIIRQNWQFFFSGDTSPIGDTSPLAQSAPTKLAIPGHFGGGPYRPEGDVYIFRGLRVELCGRHLSTSACMRSACRSTSQPSGSL